MQPRHSGDLGPTLVLAKAEDVIANQTFMTLLHLSTCFADRFGPNDLSSNQRNVGKNDVIS